MYHEVPFVNLQACMGRGCGVLVALRLLRGRCLVIMGIEEGLGVHTTFTIRSSILPGIDKRTTLLADCKVHSCVCSESWYL